MHAENAYVFRHALLRDAAYQLQLPGDRSRLHRAAAAILEELSGGPPPARDPDAPWASHPRSELRDASAEAIHEHLALGGDPRKEADALEYLRRAADFAAAHHDAGRAIGLSERYAAHPRSSAAGKFEALLRALELRISFGRYGGEQGAKVAADTKRALELAAALGDASRESRIRLQMAYTQSLTGERESALDSLDQAREQARASGDRRIEGRALGQRAMILHDLDRRVEAESAYREAIEFLKGVGDRRAEGVVAGPLGVLLGLTRRRIEGCALLEDACRSLREAGDLRNLAITLVNFALTLSRLGRGDEAMAATREAVALTHQIGDVRTWASAVVNLASLELQDGRSGGAARELERAIEVNRELRNGRFAAIATGELGLREALDGRPAEAVRLWEECLAEMEAGNHIHGICYTLGRLAEFDRREGRLESAEELARRRLEKARPTGSAAMVALALSHLGQILESAARREDAAAARREAREAIEGHDDMPAIARELDLRESGSILWPRAV